MVKPRPTPVPTQTGITLDELEADTDVLIGRPSHLRELLSAYRRGRDTMAALRDPVRREAIERACLGAMMRGVDNDGRWRIDRLAVPDVTRRRLTSEAVRRCNPALWAQSRVPGYRLSVASATMTPPRLSAVQTGTVGQLIATMRHDGVMAVSAVHAADTARVELITTYQEIDAARAWGGELLATRDGWVIGYTPTMTFSRSVCRSLADQQCIDTEPMVAATLTRGSVRWRVIDTMATCGADRDDAGDAYAE